MTTGSLGLRERKKLRTRAAIEEAALRLFAEKGFDHTTVEEIAAAVDLSPRTFFRYFPTKEDVAFAQFEPALNRLVEKLHEVDEGKHELETIRSALLSIAAAIERHRDAELARAHLIESKPSLSARALQMQDQWERVIAAELAANAGLPEPDVRLRLIATVALAANRVAFELWRDSRTRSGLPQFVEHTFDLLINEVSHVARDGQREALDQLARESRK